LNAQTDPYNGNKLKSAGKDVIIMVNNLCPGKSPAAAATLTSSLIEDSRQ
jgi:hypothetical protein